MRRIERYLSVHLYSLSVEHVYLTPLVFTLWDICLLGNIYNVEKFD